MEKPIDHRRVRHEWFQRAIVRQPLYDKGGGWFGPVVLVALFVAAAVAVAAIILWDGR